MPGDAYLLDTCIASIALDAGSFQHLNVRKQLASFDDSSTVWISAITIGEIEYGLGLYPWLDSGRSQSIRDGFAKYEVLHTDKHTGYYYGSIRAALFKQYAPRDARNKIRKGTRAEDLTDRTTSKTLGIQENDLWIAALAVEYNIVLVTRDKMSRILEAAKDLHCYDRSLVLTL